jgi:Tfp pilus assembly protein PilZ
LLINYKINNEPFSTYTFLISKKGMFLRSTKPLPVGSEIHLSFELGEGGRQIECDAVVTKAVTAEDKKELLKYPQGMEVQFSHISPADLAHLSDWLEKVASS